MFMLSLLSFWYFIRCLIFAIYLLFLIFFFFKQKTAYEMRISDWSSDVCSSDLLGTDRRGEDAAHVDDADAGQSALGGCLAGGEIGRASCRERVCQYV